jgi:hypothetical protein
VSGAFLLLPLQVQVFDVPSLAVSVERLPVARVAGAGLVTTLVTSTIGLATFAVAELAGVGHADAPRWADGLALGVGGLVPVPALEIVLAVAAIAAGIRTIP